MEEGRKGRWREAVKWQTGRVEEKRADEGVNGGMEEERKNIREVAQWWRGNRLSCSPGKGDLFVSVGLCYSPDVSIIGP